MGPYTHLQTLERELKSKRRGRSHGGARREHDYMIRVMALLLVIAIVLMFIAAPYMGLVLVGVASGGYWIGFRCGNPSGTASGKPAAKPGAKPKRTGRRGYYLR